jgi:hypothetical protein
MIRNIAKEGVAAQAQCPTCLYKLLQLTRVYVLTSFALRAGKPTRL